MGFGRESVHAFLVVHSLVPLTWQMQTRNQRGPPIPFGKMSRKVVKCELETTTYTLIKGKMSNFLHFASVAAKPYPIFTLPEVWFGVHKS